MVCECGQNHKWSTGSSDRDNCVYNMAHLEKRRQLAKGKARHTVHSNSHGFGQYVSICANKGGDPAQRIELEVFQILNRSFGLDELDV